LKLRVSVAVDQARKTVGFIATRSVSFEVALFGARVDQRVENKGNYHNPTRQRGIFANTAETHKTQSLADAAGWDRHKLAIAKGRSQGRIVFCLCGDCHTRRWA
jgi:hypothetical protein